jgi:hypothetical protein
VAAEVEESRVVVELGAGALQVVSFTVTPIDCEPVLVFMNCSLATKSLVVSLVV